MTTEQLMEMAIRTIRRMSPDEKRELRKALGQTKRVN